MIELKDILDVARRTYRKHGATFDRVNIENNISFSVINHSQESFKNKENNEKNGVIIDFDDKSKSYYCDATRANLEGLTTIIPLSKYREVNLFSNYFEIYWSTKNILVAVPSNSKLPHMLKIEFKNKEWRKDNARKIK